MLAPAYEISTRDHVSSRDFHLVPMSKFGEELREQRTSPDEHTSSEVPHGPYQGYGTGCP